MKSLSELKVCAGCGKTPDVDSSKKWTRIRCPRCKGFEVFERADGFERAYDGAIKLWNNLWGGKDK